MRAALPTLSLLLLVACPKGDDGTTDDTDTDTDAVPSDAVDLRVEFPAPEWDDATILQSGAYVIPAFTEKQFCLFGTWEGPTVGIHQFKARQLDGGHHFIIAGTQTTERVTPDGEVLDCTASDTVGMDGLDPIIIGGELDTTSHVNAFSLPEGMGARLTTGQRYILQSHYINTSDKPVVVQDELQLELLDEDEVETWAAPFVHTETDLDIPPGASEIEVTCTWEAPPEDGVDAYTLLYLGGHLHEWGSHFSIDATIDGETERIYDVPRWDPLFRDAPEFADFGGEDYTVKAGDTFTTTCAWDNDTSGSLGFPQEMCVAFGMIYPAKVSVICEQD